MIPGAKLAWSGAIAALLVLGWWAGQPRESPLAAARRATLWTEGAGADVGVSTERLRAALPDATAAPADALRVSDAATLRRRLPALEEIELRGNGVDPSDAAALRGLKVVWQHPTGGDPGPALMALAAPSHLNIGQRLVVQGAVAGVGAAGARLTLSAPDGTVESLPLAPATGVAPVPFSISSSPARAPGNFEWQLRLEPGGELLPVGVSVVAPPAPRVLILQASPQPEVGRLQRWLAAAQGQVTTRTRVSADRFRFSASPGAPAEFAGLSASVLRQFDLLIMTESAVVELSPEETQAILDAVREEGLGLLVLGEINASAAGSRLLAWPLPATSGDRADDRRLLRLQGPNGAEFAEWVSLAASELPPRAFTRALVTDSQGRALAAAQREGRGWLARSVLLDTWRWQQAGHGEAFSAYWSELLSAIARPMVAQTGGWSLAAPDEPRRVNEPIELIWQGPVDQIPSAAQISHGEPRQTLTLPVARAAGDGATGYMRYWPAAPGWHHVRSGGEAPALSFYVQAPAALPGLRAVRRRQATAALVSEPGSAAAAAGVERGATALPTGSLYSIVGYAAFATFLASMALIWLRERGGAPHLPDRR